MRRPLALCTLLALASVSYACVKNPVTGKRQLSLVSEKQEIAMGQQAAEQIAAGLGLVEDPQLQQYVSSIGMEMARASERPDLPWSFQVIDDPTVNAFALPGGPIFITRGILTHMGSEAELASVLGHEIGHVTAKHSVQMISRQQLTQLGLGLGMVLVPELQGLGGLAGAGLQLLFLKHGRDAEEQADDLGFRYMLEQQYDVREMADMFRTLERASGQEGQGQLPEWLSTHPNPANRVEKTLARVSELPQDRFTTLEADREAFLRRLDGMVFGQDPNQGYFVGTQFFHPGMRFQLAFPGGWQTQNVPQAVVGASPQQDAVVQLQVAGKGAPDQTLREFLSQQGIQPATGGAEVPGLQSASSGFVAQTEQGVVEGIATFVSHGGVTFGLVALAPQGGLAANAAQLQSTIASFQPLEDPARLDVEPARLELVELSSPMRVEDFYRQHPSSVPLEQVALINGVEPGGTIPAGLAKRVVGGKIPGRE